MTDSKHREYYRAGYSAGWSDGRRGEPMQDERKAAMFFGPEIHEACQGLGCEVCGGTGEKPLPPVGETPAPPSEPRCNFMVPTQIQPCSDVWPDDQSMWCGRCLLASQRTQEQ